MLIIKPPDLITLEIRINWISLWSWVLSFKRKVQQAFVILFPKTQPWLSVGLECICTLTCMAKNGHPKQGWREVFHPALCQGNRAEVILQYLKVFQLLILIWGMPAVRSLLTDEVLLVKSGEVFVFGCLNTAIVRIKVMPKVFNIHYY